MSAELCKYILAEDDTIKSSTNFMEKGKKKEEKKIETTAAILNTLFSYAQNGLWNKSLL